MGSWDEKISRFLRRTEKHHLWMSIALAFVYFMANNTVNAVSTWTELSRTDTNTHALWEPFIWEYSSAISTTLLIIPLALVFRQLTISTISLKALLLIHLTLATLFSVCHVFLMVMMRKAVYLLSERSYEFGPLFREFFYEYRKDLWGYFTLVIFYYLLRFSYRRLIGQASPVNKEDASGNESPDGLPENLLVKKLNREFLVRVADIQWIEAAGNYVNLHTAKGVYPLRMTMKRFCDQANVHSIYRIHRSYAAHANAISDIRYDESGDGTITLTSGASLPVSRRYKSALKAALSPVA
ncbi:LytR/AlgR family response regulator transcription factor [Alteromonas sp. H39]|uniref:LytR/AlgR family response regulator transcription factor n=1 Tax=Alteromonas sp. H39 TaxID=3389876 RepID=UPI0039E09E41